MSWGTLPTDFFGSLGSLKLGCALILSGVFGRLSSGGARAWGWESLCQAPALAHPSRQSRTSVLQETSPVDTEFRYQGNYSFTNLRWR